MRTFRNLWLGLAVAIALVGLATTSSAEIDYDSATAAGVEYDYYSDTGELVLVGKEDAAYAIYDINGNTVESGYMDRGEMTFLAGDDGVGPDGTVVYVIVENDLVAVTDPDWQWD